MNFALRILAIFLLCVGLSINSQAQQGQPVGPTAPCSAFGTAAGTCAQGNDARLGAGAVTGAVKSNGSNTFSQAASSDLSDSGAWTSFSPTITCGTGTVGTYSRQNGYYQQHFGKSLTLSIDVQAALGTCTGTIAIPLPNSLSSFTNSRQTVSGVDYSLTAPLFVVVVGGSSTFSVSTLAGANPTGSDNFILTGTLQTN